MCETRYRYRKIEGWESAYEVRTKFGNSMIGEVGRNGPNDWIAETNDGFRGTGRTRDAAVGEALRNRSQERAP